MYLTLSNNKLTRIPGKERVSSIIWLEKACLRLLLKISSLFWTKLNSSQSAPRTRISKMESELKYTWNTEKSISKLKLLKELFLDNNGISTIRQKTFENNEQLEWLHLGIISTGTGSFVPSGHLTSLDGQHALGRLNWKILKNLVA